MAQVYPQDLASLFVVSYDSQGYSGGIRPRLHTNRVKNTAHFCTSVVAVGICLRVFADVTQQQLPYICLFCGRCLAAGVVYTVIT
jgi:hypothetical protein